MLREGPGESALDRRIQCVLASSISAVDCTAASYRGRHKLCTYLDVNVSDGLLLQRLVRLAVAATRYIAHDSVTKSHHCTQTQRMEPRLANNSMLPRSQRLFEHLDLSVCRQLKTWLRSRSIVLLLLALNQQSLTVSIRSKPVVEPCCDHETICEDQFSKDVVGVGIPALGRLLF